MNKIYFLLFLDFLLGLNAQNEKKIISCYLNSPPRIDGILVDSAWLWAPLKRENFFCQFPYDTGLAKYPTSVSITHDAKALFVAAQLRIPPGKKPLVQSLKRDFSYPVNDAFVLTLDPFADGQNGFSFGLNPYGSQREGAIQSGGGMGVTTNWDNIWQSASRFNDSLWTLEIRIPFKSIRYIKNQPRWKINFSRNNLYANESSNWQKVPRPYNNSSLAYTGWLEFEIPPQKTGRNLVLIPYGLIRNNLEFRPAYQSQWQYNAGADLKWTPSNSMNLDVTLNPDFSQVEADRQVLNLSRFSVFFPEQRQFFIENSDLFERFGFRQIRPFFSRKIGLFNGEMIPIAYGARLSGKPSKRWRMGLMNLQTLRKELSNLTQAVPENFSVGAFQYNVFARSNIAGIVVHRMRSDSVGKYNTVMGLDYNLASKDNRWMGKLFFHNSLDAHENNSDAYAHASWITYQDMYWNISWNHEYVNRNYRAETGFTPRIFQTDIDGIVRRFTYWRLEPNVYRYFYPKSKFINQIMTGIYSDIYFNQKWINTDQLIKGLFEISGQSTWSVSVALQHHYTKLLFPTDVSFSGLLTPIPSGDYAYRDILIRFTGNQRKDIIPMYQLLWGQYFNGYRTAHLWECSFRVRPYVNLFAGYSREEILLPDSRRALLHLINPRLEITFTPQMYLTFFWQYNTQNQNINLNARFQWRFRPMCDFYLVWIDNYYGPEIAVRNRIIVSKLILWINT